MEKKYYKRLSDQKLETYLMTFGAVLIEGPKWCGKTTTASQHAKSVLKMQDPTQMRNNIQIADVAPELLLIGDRPRLIDEWQVAPVLWDAIRISVDEHQLDGQFILTGSNTPPKDVTLHTGTGRFGRLLMRPMSLYESLESSGEISLKGLFEGEPLAQCKSHLDIKDLALIICRGGWPQSLGRTEESALLITKEYVKSIYSQDINVDGKSSKDPNRVRSFLRSYARNIQTLTKNTTILRDMQANDLNIDGRTLYTYLSALQKIFIVEETPAWSPNIRSKTAIRTSNKKGFVDPSIATAILGQTPSSLLKDFEMFGYLFESLCIRDLRIYSDLIDGSIYHYHDDYGLECDAVIRLNNGDYALVEIKLGGKEEEFAAENLLKLENLLKTKGFDAPRFKMILTGGEFAYQRKDSVLVVPLGCLKN